MGYAFYIWVFAGGMLGSILREVITPLFPAQIEWFPILIINTLAALKDIGVRPTQLTDMFL